VGFFGLTSAYYVKHYNPQISVALFEKEADVGQGNTSKSVGAYRQGIYTSRANQLLAETTIEMQKKEVRRG
jgi:L-2-hydroxyglutarate oxidase LhgO